MTAVTDPNIILPRALEWEAAAIARPHDDPEWINIMVSDGLSTILRDLRQVVGAPGATFDILLGGGRLTGDYSRIGISFLWPDNKADAVRRLAGAVSRFCTSVQRFADVRGGAFVWGHPPVIQYQTDDAGKLASVSILGIGSGMPRDAIVVVDDQH